MAFLLLHNYTDFIRFLTHAFIAVTMLVLLKLLHKYVGDRLICIAYVLPFFAVKAGGRFFRGDELAILLISVAEFMFVLALCEESKRAGRSLLSGFVAALAVMVYPALLPTFAFMLIGGGICEFAEARRIRISVRFLAGAAAAALATLAVLSAENGLMSVFQGIRYIMTDVTYWRLRGDAAANMKSYMAAVSYIFVRLAASVLLVFGFLSFALFLKAVFGRSSGTGTGQNPGSSHLLRKRSFGSAGQKLAAFFGREGRPLLLLSLTGGTALCTIACTYLNRGPAASGLNYLITTIFLMAGPMFLPFVRTHRRLCCLLFLFVWAAEQASKFFLGFAAYGGLYERNAYLHNVSYLAILFAGLAAKDTFLGPEKVQPGGTLFRRAAAGLVPIMLSGAMCGCFIYGAYAYMYREADFSLLTSRVESGPYKGLYTTQERNDGVTELEKYVRRYTSSEDLLLVMDNDPFIYLMSDAVPCAPSTWDMALYSYKFDEPQLYYDYFRVTGREPTKIIYMNYGRDEVMSIDTDYRFNEFVKEKYELIYENRNIFEWDFCGRRLSCELLVFSRKDEYGQTSGISARVLSRSPKAERCR